MLKNVPNLYRAAKHVDRSQTLAGQSLEPILALKNVEVPLSDTGDAMFINQNSRR
jgi:hypothetical protein